MDAVDGVAHILARGNDHRKGEKDHRADAPMQAEHGGIDVNMADLNQGLESEEYVEHDGATSRANLDPAAVGGSANTELARSPGAARGPPCRSLVDDVLAPSLSVPART